MSEAPKVLLDLVPAIEAGLRRYAWPETGGAPPHLVAAMNASLFAGGKRLRPALVLLASEACGGSEAAAMPVACAFEIVHTYSLIHDDLPAMDNADLRRGLPACHKAFGEATAILAGDGMLTRAFELLADQAGDAQRCRELVALLGRAAGMRGMVGGQQADLEAEGRTDGTADSLASLHLRKTGALIAASLAAGGIVAGADASAVRALEGFGRTLGLAFQVADDVLDVTRDSHGLGKTAGGDAHRGKLTYPALLGIEGARLEAQRLLAEARALARNIPRNGKLLEIAEFVVSRTK